jgi:hypothetical protein
LCDGLGGDGRRAWVTATGGQRRRNAGAYLEGPVEDILRSALAPPGRARVAARRDSRAIETRLAFPAWNQRKVGIARSMRSGASVLLLAEPSAGVDVGPSAPSTTRSSRSPPAAPRFSSLHRRALHVTSRRPAPSVRIGQGRSVHRGNEPAQSLIHPTERRVHSQ